jgi:uncharacterized protein
MVVARLLLWLFLLVTPAFAAAPVCGGNSVVDELPPDRLAAAFARGAAAENSEGLLWRIEKPGVAASHLFGTMHVTDPRAVALAAPVRAALSGARLVALELKEAADPQTAAQIGVRMVQAAMAPGADNLAFLSDPTARRTVEAMLGEYGIPAEAAKQFRPWFLALVLAFPPCEMARQAAGLQAVDVVVAAERPAAAQLIGLETVDEQVGLFVGMDDEVARLNLSSAPRFRARMNDIFATLVDLYLRRRYPALIEVFTASGLWTQTDVDSYIQVEQWLRGVRDARMAERALPHLARGGAFVAVGALHLPGPDGLVERFRRAGYSVTKVW